MGTAGSLHSAAGADVPSVPSATDIEVEPDKLFEVAAAIESQAQALRERVRTQLDALRIERPSIDIVSRHAVQGWNAVIVEGGDSYYGRVLTYIDELQALAEQLHAAGERYHGSDDEKSVAIAQAGSGY